jgi:hypothetical protein
MSKKTMNCRSRSNRSCGRNWIAGASALLLCAAASLAHAQVTGVMYAISTSPNNIYAINQTNGTGTVLYANYPGDSSAAMAQRPTDGMIFFIGETANDYVYRWNPATPATAPVLLGTTGAGVEYIPRLACSANGTIYGVGSTPFTRSIQPLAPPLRSPPMATIPAIAVATLCSLPTERYTWFPAPVYISCR